MLAFQESPKSVPEIILHRIDAFDLSVRNVLNIGAVLGKSFRLAEVVAVMKEYHESKEEDIQSEAIAALDIATAEGILCVERGGPKSNDAEGKEDDDEEEEEDNPLYSFLHQIWKDTILSLLLDSRKKDVHRKIAQAMEEKLQKESCDFEFKTKLLGHWKSSGDTAKLAELALSLGKSIEQQLGLPTQSIRLYEEALSAWRDESVAEADIVAGEFRPTDIPRKFSIPSLQPPYIFLSSVGVPKVTLDFIGPDDLKSIAEIQVALGRALGAARRFADSVTCYQNAVQVRSNT